MKTKSLILVAASICLAATAQAEGKGGKERKGGRPLPPEIVMKFDTNKDGKIDKEERMAQKEEIKKAMKEHRAAMLEKFDADKDGKLSREERKAMVMERFDKDGDGTLSDEEKAEMKEAWKGRKGKGAKCKKCGPKGKKGKKDKGEE